MSSHGRLLRRNRWKVRKKAECNRYRVDDGHGGCAICHADRSMWCDLVAHRQAAMPPVYFTTDPST